jgi:hypothetical protein
MGLFQEKTKTAIGEVWKQGDLIRLDIINTDISLKTLKEHYQVLESVFGTRKNYYIFTFRDLAFSLPSAEIRKFNNVKLEKTCAAVAVVTENIVIRVLVRTYLKLSNFKCDITIHKTHEDAELWLRDQKLQANNETCAS